MLSRNPALLWRMAAQAWATADKWAASDAPWALRNLRLYQGQAIKYETEAARLERGHD